MHGHDQPRAISGAEHERRLRQLSDIAYRLGFAGHVEYRHTYSRSGGAQYCIGPSAAEDLLMVYAEAFERDADPEDFSLDALVAHECGHQRLLRNPALRKVLISLPGEAIEEVLASLVGSLLLGDSLSARTLVWKATVELGNLGITGENTVHFIERLRGILRSFL